MSGTGFPKRVEDRIITRDQGCCARCGRHVVTAIRGRDWAIHHRRPRGIGGTGLGWVNEAGNGVVLCARCHWEVEMHRTKATEAGFLVPMNGTAKSSEVPIAHALLGRVRLLDDGLAVPVGAGPDETWKEA